MANYTSPLLQAPVSAAFKSAGLLIAAATRRIMLYEIELGQTGSLSTTDCQVQWDLSRFGTTVGLAATSVAPDLMDTADTAAASTFANNATVELTYTTAGNGLALKSWGINQRGSYRWRALDDGDNLLVPATALMGIGIRCLSSNFTSTAIGNISFIER